MISAMLRVVGATVVTAGMATSAFAQVSTSRVAADTDWSVFVEENPTKECWGVSAPKETVNSRDGKPVAVRRSDILLFVSFRPGVAHGEVSASLGYPVADGVSPKLEVAGQSFELFSPPQDDPSTPDMREDEFAWSPSADDDAKIIAALRAGSTAVLTAQSARGTLTTDTFSLLGISAVLDEAAKRCAG